MWMFPKGDLTIARLRSLLMDKLLLSRFTADLYPEARLGGKLGLKVECIRLRRKKGYCGAHPGPCQVTGRKHKKAAYLEGLDWVGFNALINDMLDEISASCLVFSFNRECVQSGRYFIRRDTSRRTRYPFQYIMDGRNALWTQDKVDYETCFADHCGKPPPVFDAAYQDLDGTPGYPVYTFLAETAYREKYGEEIEDHERMVA